MTFKKSLILAISYFFIFIIWKACEKLIGLHDNNINLYPFISDLIIIPLILLYSTGFKKYRIGLGGKITFINGIGFGLMATLFIVALTPVSVWIFDQFINPNFYASMIQYQIKNHVSTLEIAQQSFNHENFKQSCILGNAVTGTLLTVVLAIISSKKSA
jgi:hypothetical protein